MEVFVGVDSHKSTLAAAAVDELGRVLAAGAFKNDHSGHQQLVRWAQAQGESRTIGIEGAGRYGAPLARHLVASGRRSTTTLAYRERQRNQTRGKSDALDAAAIARVVARGDGFPTASPNPILEDLKLLSDYCEQLVCERNQLTNRIHADLVQLSPGYEQAVANLTAKKHLKAALSIVRR